MAYFENLNLHINSEDFLKNSDRLEFMDLKEKIRNHEIQKNKMNLLDEIFFDNLESLKTKRHLLSKDEEDFINSIANRLKY
jgi:hypothetical protein